MEGALIPVRTGCAVRDMVQLLYSLLYLTADMEQYESLLQNAAMKYYFYEMPEKCGMDDLIASWGE